MGVILKGEVVIRKFNIGIDRKVDYSFQAAVRRKVMQVKKKKVSV